MENAVFGRTVPFRPLPEQTAAGEAPEDRGVWLQRSSPKPLLPRSDQRRGRPSSTEVGGRRSEVSSHPAGGTGPHSLTPSLTPHVPRPRIQDSRSRKTDLGTGALHSAPRRPAPPPPLGPAAASSLQPPSALSPHPTPGAPTGGGEQQRHHKPRHPGALHPRTRSCKLSELGDKRPSAEQGGPRAGRGGQVRNCWKRSPQVERDAEEAWGCPSPPSGRLPGSLCSREAFPPHDQVLTAWPQTGAPCSAGFGGAGVSTDHPAPSPRRPRPRPAHTC